MKTRGAVSRCCCEAGGTNGSTCDDEPLAIASSLCVASASGAIWPYDEASAIANCGWYTIDVGPNRNVFTGSDGNFTMLKAGYLQKHFSYDYRVKKGVYFETTSYVPTFNVPRASIAFYTELSINSGVFTGLSHYGLAGDPPQSFFNFNSPNGTQFYPGGPYVSQPIFNNVLGLTTVSETCTMRVEFEITGPSIESGRSFIFDDYRCWDIMPYVQRRFVNGSALPEITGQKQFWGWNARGTLTFQMQLYSDTFVPVRPTVSGSSAGYIEYT